MQPRSACFSLRLKKALALTALCLTAACAQNAQEITPSESVQRAPAQNDQAEPAAAPSERPEPSPLIAQVETQTIVEDAPVVPDIDRLSGIRTQEVRALMGDPDLFRKDGNVEIMLFENSHCVLEVILSETSNAGIFISERVSTRTLRGAPTDGGQCLKTHLPGGVFPF